LYIRIIVAFLCSRSILIRTRGTSCEDDFRDAKGASQPPPPAVPGWMIHSTEDQLARLRKLLAQSPLSRIE